MEVDMAEHYGIDLAEPGLLDRRSNRWLRVRIAGLLNIESRLRFVLFPPKEEEVGHGPEGR